MPPSRTIVFDFETLIPEINTFTIPTRDVIHTISFATSTSEGTWNSVQLWTIIPSLKDNKVNSSKTDNITFFPPNLSGEKLMLEQFFLLLIQFDVDLTYNGLKFDWPYLI